MRFIYNAMVRNRVFPGKRFTVMVLTLSVYQNATNAIVRETNCNRFYLKRLQGKFNRLYIIRFKNVFIQKIYSFSNNFQPLQTYLLN